MDYIEKALLSRLEVLINKKAEDILNNEYFSYNLSSNSPVLFMSHADVVPRKTTKFKKYNNYIYEYTGADDKVGIAIIQELYKNYNINYLITNYEESGGLGASQFIKQINKNKLSHIRLIVSFDRAGSNHYVIYNRIKNLQYLEDYLENLGLFDRQMGSYSDCYDISEHYGIGSINIACGYYKQHTEQEYINLKEVAYAYELGFMIYNNPPQQKIKALKSSYSYNYLDYEDLFFNNTKYKFREDDIYEDSLEDDNYNNIYELNDDKFDRNRIKRCIKCKTFNCLDCHYFEY